MGSVFGRNTDTYSYSHTYSHTYGHTYSDTYSDPGWNTVTYSNNNTHCYPNGNADCYPNTDAFGDAIDMRSQIPDLHPALDE
jgi:hypothetical protein